MKKIFSVCVSEHSTFSSLDAKVSRTPSCTFSRHFHFTFQSRYSTRRITVLNVSESLSRNNRNGLFVMGLFKTLLLLAVVGWRIR